MTDATLRSVRTVLHQHQQAHALSSSDVHVALTLVRLTGDDRPEVALAVAYAAQAPRRGDVAVDLSRVRLDVEAEAPDAAAVASLVWPEPRRWVDAVRSSRLCTATPPALVVRGPLVFLHRYDDYEQRVAAQVVRRAQAVVPQAPAEVSVAAQLLTGPGADRQVAAVRAACARALSIIIGGPGTGKTTTVAALLAEVVASGPPDASPRVALAAPTGKAAARLGEALRAAAERLPAEVRPLVAHVDSSTIHRLLGWSTRGKPRFHRHHPLPHDLVVIDETSMVSLPLMARLLDAVRHDARLVLVGDADQLASVEAGNVLGDLVAGAGRGLLAGCLTELTVSRRFDVDSPLDRLARAVRAGDVDGALAALASPGDDPTVRGRVTWIDRPGDHADARTLLGGDVDATSQEVVRRARAGEAHDALAALTGFRVLCAHRHGPHGVSSWNRWIERRLGAELGDRSPWYPGRPVMATRNDPSVGVFNGDLGVVVVRDGSPCVAFAASDAAGEIRLMAPSRLPAVDTVHALTIHKSQGSEFAHVAVVLPPASSRLSSRELLYTAITRATHHVTVVGDAAAVASAVARRSHRTGDLAARLADIDQAPQG